MSGTLVLLRHGQSEYNKKNIFTGWIDVELSAEGRLEALKARELLKNYDFDVVYTSALKRAKDTALIVLGEKKTALISNSALNERCYGELEGKNKDEVRALFGAEQVQIWRRSLRERPPGGESLEDTCERVLRFYDDEIKPKLAQGQTILVCAHGNSLRALVMSLENLSEEEVLNLEIPTGVPIIYEFDAQGRAYREKEENKGA
jgi:2,3-bisphosphoglycerate-dependent phosphoglycerate mutase